MEARARFLPHARRAKHTPLCCTCLVGWGMETLGQGVRATGQEPAFACRDFGLCMSSPQTYECERTCYASSSAARAPRSSYVDTLLHRCCLLLLPSEHVHAKPLSDTTRPLLCIK